MMGAFGRFLELSVPTAEILRSLAFYRELGFAELTTGDIRRYHYAVVADGALAIGLHAAGIDEPALSFVRPNLAKQVPVLETAGHQIEFRRLGADEFHEAALRSPDGQLIVMMEARTFSPGADDEGTVPLIGRCTEISLACHDPAATKAFWETAGFLPAETQEPDVILVTAPNLTLGLREPGRAGTIALRFQPPGGNNALKALEAKGLSLARTPEGQVLKSPEGLRLIVG
jgi:catechol 2,3-dioxygenase-like lactoylglutathione lyase family enzyme